MIKITRDEALEYHSRAPKGKIEVVPTKPPRRSATSRSPTPPAWPSPASKSRGTRDLVYEYTAKGNLVAVISNGTAVLGLGNIGAAGRQAGHGGQGRPLQALRRHRRLRHRDRRPRIPRRSSGRSRLLEPTFGGINLEDIKAPECFEIERAAQGADEHPGLPRRPARHRDHLGRGAAQRPRDRRQEASTRSSWSSPAPAPPPSRCVRLYLELGMPQGEHHPVRPQGRHLRGRTEGHESATRWSSPPRRRRATWPRRWWAPTCFVGLSVAGARHARDAA